MGKQSTTSLHLRPSATLDTVKDSTSMLRFFMTSGNEMVAYHRQVVLAALLPLLFGFAAVGATFADVFHTPFAFHAAHFVNLLCMCYSAEIVKTKLLPRQQTYEKWNEYMSSVRHNRHVCSVLMAYHMQMEYGNAPPEGSDEAANVPPEAYNIWKGKNAGLTPTEVQIKYVNFCWRYAYRLWCNKISLAEKESRLLHSEEAHTRSTNKELHGDTHSMEAPEKLLDSGEHAKFRALQKLANRVNRFADVLQGGPDAGASGGESAEHPRDEQVLARLRAQMHGPHDSEHH